MQANDLISFTDNDYLGLSTDPRVVEAAAAATREYGAGAGASRLVTGNHPLYTELEARLAAAKGQEAAIIFGSGYMANSGIIPALVGPGDLIIADELIHASLHAGLRLSGATAHYFAHGDADDAARLLKNHRSGARHAIVIVDGVYSMDGDRAPIQALVEMSDQAGAWLMVDDAHGFGVLGGGRGSVHEAGMTGRVPLIMGTLSKALGSYGGFLAASQPVIDLMKSRARSLIYTTGLPAGCLAAALKALDIIEAEPERCQKPMDHARYFAAALGLSAPESPIVPIMLGSESRALQADQALQSKGFRLAAFRPPTVPDGTARLRVSFSATHTDAQVKALIAAIRSLDLNLKGAAA